MPKGPDERPFVVYLAGPMSKYKDDPDDPYGFQRFHRAARRLRELGVVVMSPAETGGQVRIMPRRWYFAFDYNVIGQCDAVVVLPNWRESTGAKSEVIYATEMGIPVYSFSSVYGLGSEIRVTGWSVDWEWGPRTEGWKSRVRKDPSIAPPVEAFPERVPMYSVRNREIL